MRWKLERSQTIIKSIRAREVLDCRGDPTLEVDVITDSGTLGRADVPAGKSTGIHEAKEIRDGESRYFGKGVKRAIQNVTGVIAPALIGRDVTNQRECDTLMIELDGTDDKSKLGANAIVGVSLAIARAGANALGIPLYRHIGDSQNKYSLPIPILDYIEGGKIASTDLDFQEHQAVPFGASSFSEAITMGSEVYHELGKMLEQKWGKHSLNVGVEGGYSPPGMKDPRQAFEIELKAIEEMGYGNKFCLSLDAAASHLYNSKTGKYNFMGSEITRDSLIELYQDLVSTYPLRSIEDPLQQEDYEGFAEVTKKLGIQIIGDDLFVTNPKRLKRGIEMGAANALLLKVNQIGTLSEALDAAKLSFSNGYEVQVSERSGQTEDTWLAQITVGIGAGQIKTGCPCRGERTAQYNELLRIEEELGISARYSGCKFFTR
jgi:enolase